MKNVETAAERMAAGGAATGFDYLRLILAASVVLWHSLESSYGSGTPTQVWHHARALISLILPMFFALSGFLVSGSLTRTSSIIVFMAHRFLRLIPALAVEILLSALLLGPILTNLSRTQYFAGVEFRNYFLNVVGMIHYHLPGVFLGNPTPGIVNRSLWTIPYELECYLALIVLTIAGLAKHRLFMTALVVLGSVGFLVMTNAHHSAVLASVGPPGRLLVFSFLAGVTLYLWRELLPLHLGVFFCSLGLTLACLAFAQTMFLAALPVAYVTVYLGLARPPRIPFLMDGDYSYGLYLFAYPLQQTYVLLFPNARVWWLNSIFALSLGLCYAFLSWHLVEKRILSHRKGLTAVIERVLEMPMRLKAALAR